MRRLGYLATAVTMAGLLALGVSAPASAVSPSHARARAATAATTVDLHMSYVDAYDFDLAGQVVHGGFTLGRTTATGSGKYTTTDGESITFLLSVHRRFWAARGNGRLFLSWKGSIVLAFQFRAQWNGTTLTGSADAIWVTQLYGSGKYFPVPANLALTVNIGA